MVLAFTKKTDCNIISIDWQAGAEPPFEQAIANARVVALETKLFITLLSVNQEKTILFIFLKLKKILLSVRF